MSGGSCLVVLVGPAGAGKTTLAHRLIGRRPDRRAFSVSHTTRAMRPGEEDGRDYHFVSRAAFEALRAADGFVEWAEVHGNLYGTSVAEIERLASEGRDALFDIDIQGAHQVWHKFPEITRLCFVLPPSWAVLVDRLGQRGTETEATLRRRLRTARQELQAVLASPAPWHVITNDALDRTAVELEALFTTPAPPPSDTAHHPALRTFLLDAAADPRATAAA